MSRLSKTLTAPIKAAFAVAGVMIFATGCAGNARAFESSGGDLLQDSGVAYSGVESLFPVFQKPSSSADILPKSLAVDIRDLGLGTTRHVGIADGVDYYLTNVGGSLCIQFGKDSLDGFVGGTACDKANKAASGLAVLNQALQIAVVAVPDACSLEPGPNANQMRWTGLTLVRDTDTLSGEFNCAGKQSTHIELTSVPK